MGKSLIIFFLFYSSSLFGQYFKDYKSIHTANQEEREMYELMKEVILSSEKDTSIIHIFPLYFVSEKKEDITFRSFMYAEPTESSYSRKLESATYYISLTFPNKEIDYNNTKLLGLDKDASAIKEFKNEIRVFDTKEKSLKFNSKPIFRKETDSVFLRKFDIQKIVYKKNDTSNLIDSTFYKMDEGYVRFVNKDYMVVANKNNLMGILTPPNIIKLPFEYQLIQPYAQGILVKKDNSAYFIDFHEKKLSKEYENITPLSELSIHYKDFKIAKRNNKSTIINAQFEEILPFYENITLFSPEYKEDDRFIIRNEGKQFLFNPNSWKEASNKYDELSPLDKTWYIVVNERKVGIIDNNGSEILENIYDSISLAESYHESPNQRILFIKKNNKLAIFKNNKFISDFEFESIKDYLYGKLFIVSKKGKFGIIKQNMEIFIPLKYESKDFIKEPEIQNLLISEIEKHNR